MYRFIIAIFYCILWFGLVAPGVVQAQDEINASGTIEVSLYGPGREPTSTDQAFDSKTPL